MPNTSERLDIPPPGRSSAPLRKKPFRQGFLQLIHNMKRIRKTLGMIGGIGLFAYPALSLVAWLFHDWKPGGSQGGLSMLAGWYCVVCLMVVSAYYVAVAAVEWCRRFLIVGLAIHLALFLAAVILISATDAGWLIAPMICLGPALWLVYATRIGATPG